MKRPTQDDYLRKVLANPTEWNHVPKIKRKNNLHTKSDDRTRKEIFEHACQMLRLMGIKFMTRQSYFIKLESNTQ